MPDLSCPGCWKPLKERTHRKLGLCKSCLKKPAVVLIVAGLPRPAHQSTRGRSVAERGNRGIVPDIFAYPVPPEQPTDAMPGTSERIEVMRQRLERREALWHPQDPGRLNLERFEGVLA